MVTSDLYGLQKIEDLAGMQRAQHGILLAQSRISLATQAYAVGSFLGVCRIRQFSGYNRQMNVFYTCSLRELHATKEQRDQRLLVNSINKYSLAQKLISAVYRGRRILIAGKARMPMLRHQHNVDVHQDYWICPYGHRLSNGTIATHYQLYQEAKSRSKVYAMTSVS